MRLTEKYEYGYKIREELKNFGCIDLYVPVCKDKDVRNKLGQLEEIEEEFGVDLVTLFKALTQGIWFKGIGYGEPTFGSKPSLITEVSTQELCFKPTIFDFIYLKDYGKTWALTREELL